MPGATGVVPSHLTVDVEFPDNHDDPTLTFIQVQGVETFMDLHRC